MKQILVMLGCVAMLACSAEQRLEQAQEKQIEAQADAHATAVKAEEKILDKQVELNQAQAEAARKMAEAQEKVNEANVEMINVQTDLDTDRVEAHDGLTKRYMELDGRVARLRQRPMETDPTKQSEFAQRMAIVETELVDARAKVDLLVQAGPTEWKGPLKTAEDALDKLEASVRNAE